MTISVRLLGKFSAQCDGLPLGGMDASRVQELFAYLLLYRHRPHPREALAAALWSESGAEPARKYLRQTLWQLQSALDPAVPRVILAETDWVRLNPEADITLDVATFEDSTRHVIGVSGRDLDALDARRLLDAIDLYAGDLLHGWYQEWCLSERERLQTLFMQLLGKLMVHKEAHGDYETGVVFGARLLDIDRAHERTHRRLMRLHYLAGDRTAALRQYQRCVTALADELGVTPSRRTLQLYEQIRADQFDQVAPAPAEHYPRFIERLAELQAGLADLVRQVQDATTDAPQTPRQTPAWHSAPAQRV